MPRPEFTTEQVRLLAGVLLKTQPQELTCDEWLAEIGPYAEATIAKQPLPTNSALVEHHLDICPECREEYEALLAALQQFGPRQSP